MIVSNREIVNRALERIEGVELDGWIWFSSEYSDYSVWGVNASSGGVGYSYKNSGSFYVSCSSLFKESKKTEFYTPFFVVNFLVRNVTIL